MHFYLASWVGDGTPANEYRPNLDAAAWAAIDFRPDPTVQAGEVLVATDQPVSTLPSGVTDLGDLLDDTLKRPNIRGIEQRLGVTLQGQSLRQIIAELLIVWGESDLPGRTRWKRLQATRQGWHVIRLLNETIYAAPAPQGVAITDPFTRADADALGSSAEGWSWTEVVGDIDIASNAAAMPEDQASDVAARAESDLATVDHYAQADVTWASGGFVAGPIVRFAAAATTYYRGGGHVSSNEDRIHKVVTGTTTQIASRSHAISGTMTVRLKANGSTLEVTVGTAQPLSVTDTSITGNTRTGIGGFAGNITTATIYTFDNFRAADITHLYATSHLAGTFTNPDNALGNTPTTWAGALNTNTNATSRWAIGDPADPLTTGATQTIRVLARKGSNSGVPTIALNLYENGTLVQSILAATNVTSTTGQILTGTFLSSAITNRNDVEIEVVMVAATGGTSARNSAQVAYIEWVAETTAAAAGAQELEGTVTGVGALSASLTRIRDLAGTSAGAGTLTATLIPTRVLEGTVTAAATAEGTIIPRRALAGTLAGTSDLSGDLTPIRTLAGDVPAAAVLSGDLEIIVAGVVDLSGTVTAVATLQGDLIRVRNLTGQTIGQATLTGDLTPRRVLAGTVDAAAALTAALERVVDLTGTVDAEATLAAAIQVVWDLTGSVDAAAVLSGELGIGERPPWWSPDPVAYTRSNVGYTRTPVGYTVKT